MSAFEKLQKICAKNPTSILFARLADGLLQQGDITRAIEVCRQGLRYRPSYVAGHVVMGKCHLAAGHYEEARLEFQKVLQLDADHLSALWHLGKIDLHLGWEDLALKHFELAHALDPFCPELVEQIRGLKEEAVANEEESAPDLTTDIEDVPETDGSGELSQSDEPEEDAVDSEAKQEEDSEDAVDIPVASQEGFDALVSAPKPKSTEDTSIATATLAELYVGQGLIREAVAVLEQVVAREPDNKKAIARIDQLRTSS